MEFYGVISFDGGGGMCFPMFSIGVIGIVAFVCAYLHIISLTFSEHFKKTGLYTALVTFSVSLHWEASPFIDLCLL